MKHLITPAELTEELIKDLVEGLVNEQEAIPRLQTIHAVMKYEQEGQRFQTRKLRSAMGELMSNF